jgi:hypothetical protein
MRVLRPVALGLAAALVATACAWTLRTDEHSWCDEHAQEVVAASYRAGSPMTMAEVLAEAEADTPSPEYVRACRRAYQDR